MRAFSGDFFFFHFRLTFYFLRQFILFLKILIYFLNFWLCWVFVQTVSSGRELGRLFAAGQGLLAAVPPLVPGARAA